MTNRLVIDSADLVGKQRHNGEFQSVNAHFILHRFRFHLKPKAPLHMPAYNKGNVIRGGFGSTFRRIVCHANCREPESCELRNVCPYTAVFQPFVPEGRKGRF